jgi:hypothetical protein
MIVLDLGVWSQQLRSFNIYNKTYVDCENLWKQLKAKLGLPWSSSRRAGSKTTRSQILIYTINRNKMEMEVNGALTYVDCENLWKQLKAKLGEFRGLLPDERVQKQEEAKLLLQQYRNCMREVRPGFIQRQLNVLEEELIFGAGVHHAPAVPQYGGRKHKHLRSRRSKRSRQTRRRSTLRRLRH